jgi:hypothetical protein
VAPAGVAGHIYTRDAPAPFALRDLQGGARVAGALQSAP